MKPAAIVNDDYNDGDEIEFVVYAQTIDTNLQFHPAYPVGAVKMKVPDNTVQIILSVEKKDVPPDNIS